MRPDRESRVLRVPDQGAFGQLQHSARAGRTLVQGAAPEAPAAPAATDRDSLERLHAAVQRLRARGLAIQARTWPEPPRHWQEAAEDRGDDAELAEQLRRQVLEEIQEGLQQPACEAQVGKAAR